MRLRALVASLAMLALPVVSMAAPSWSVTINSQSSMLIDTGGAPTTPGPVSLALSANLNTDGNVISGWQHALKTDQPSLWNYGNPTVNVTAVGFANSDIVFGPPAAGSGMTDDSTGEVSVFAFSGADRGPYDGSASTEVFNVTSKAPLAPGTYTFSIGDSGLGFFMANAGTPDGITFGASTPFTLTVRIPEPASALLLLAAVPFLRRRRTA